MAYTDKNIVITPNIGSLTAAPKIVFSAADANTAAQTITLSAYPTSSGTLSFEGSAGQLFSITNSLSGTIFSVNDVSGIPSIEVLDSGVIKLAQYSGNVLLGTVTDNNTDKLQVNGSITGTRLKSTVANGTSPLVVASTTLVANLNADLLDGHDSAYYLNAENISGTISGTVTAATNLAGGSGGTIPYQSNDSVTAMLPTGTAGQALTSAGDTAAPLWATLTLANLPSSGIKKSVKAATTANITSATRNATTLTGAAGVSAVSFPSQDGITLAVDDRILLKDQNIPLENGIYYVSTLGVAGNTAWVLTRSADADTSLELAGAMVNVESGTSNGGIIFKSTLKSTATLGTTPVYWKRIVDVCTGTNAPVQTTAVGLDIATPSDSVKFPFGQVTDLAINSFGARTILSESASIYARASTVYIAGAPTASTNATITKPYALYVAGGNTYLDGSLTLGTELAVAYGGTGLTTLATGNIPYGNGTGALSSSTNFTYAKGALRGSYGLFANSSNFAAGDTALEKNISGAGNTAVGSGTLKNNTAGTNNVAIGYLTLNANTIGNYNTGLGYDCLDECTTIINTFTTIDSITGGSNYTNGSYSSVVLTYVSGPTAAVYPIVDITVSGGKVTTCTLVTFGKGFTDTTTVMTCNSIGLLGTGFRISPATLLSGDGNTAIGYQSMTNASPRSGNFSTSCSYHTAVGYQALVKTSGYGNSAVGYTALSNNTTGVQNVAVGYTALSLNTIGKENTAVGNLTLGSNSSGDSNTAVGYTALSNNTIGGSSTGVGYGSLRNSTTMVGTLGAITGGSNYQDGSYSSVALVSASGPFPNVNPVVNITVSGGIVTNCTLVTFGNGIRNTDLDGTNSPIVWTCNSIGGGTGFRISPATLVTGDQNTAIGYDSGSQITTGANNVIIGGYTGLGEPISKVGSGYVILSQTNGTIRQVIDGSGNVGFGTTSPGTYGGKLTIAGNSSTGLNGVNITNLSSADSVTKYARLSFGGVNTAAVWKSTGDISVFPHDSNYVGSTMIFSTRTSDEVTEKMRINESGDITAGGNITAGGDITAVGDITAGGDITATSYNGGQLAGFRNKIINGDMRVGQRAATAIVANTFTYGTVDRILWSIDGTITAGNIGQYLGSAGVNGYSGLTFFSGTSITAAYTQTRIEAKDAIHLNSKTITVSCKVFQNTGAAVNVTPFIAKPPATPDAFTNNPTTITSGTAVSVPSGAITTITATYTLGADDAQLGIAPSLAWTLSGSYTTRSLTVTDWQLEIGSVATPFEHRPYGMELALCQRYYETGTANVVMACNATTSTISGNISYKVEKRATPSTVTLSGGTSLQPGSFDCTPSPSSLNTSSVSIGCSATGLTIGSCYSTNITYFSSAEL